MPTSLPLTSRVAQLESGHPRVPRVAQLESGHPRECQWVTVAGNNVGGKKGTYHLFASLGLPRHEE